MKESHKKLKEVYNKGYYVNSDGEVIAPSGKARKLTLKKENGGCGDYYRFNVKINGMSYPIPVHRLVAYQKFGDKMFNEDTVRHLDGNSKNNSFDNIVIGSYSDNSFDRDEQDRKEHSMKGVMKLRKFSDDEVRYIRNSKSKQSDLCKQFGVVKGTIRGIRNRKTYQDVLDFV